MQFSIFPIAMGRGRASERQVYGDLLSDAALAEQLGFDGFWLAEHHFNSDFSMSPSPNGLLGALAVAISGEPVRRVPTGSARCSCSASR